MIIYTTTVAGERRIAAVILLMASCLTLFGGTGRPSDGLLSFLLLLGFLLSVLGVLQLAEWLKKKLDNLLEGMY